MTSSPESIEFGDVVSEGSPDPLVIDAVVGVVDDDPHSFHLCPGKLRRTCHNLVTILRDSVDVAEQLGIDSERGSALSLISALEACHGDARRALEAF